jgi:SSS family solute:Na+ symporter
MFTEDVLTHYGGKERFGEQAQVRMARGFVIALTVVAYLVALRAPESIFALAVQYAFTGYAALFPLLVAALFWKGSTKWGALASTLWAAASVAAVAVFQATVAAPAGPPVVVWRLGAYDLLARTAGGTAVLGFMPVVPIVLVSALLMVVVSWFTAKPSPATLARYARVA